MNHEAPSQTDESKKETLMMTVRTAADKSVSKQAAARQTTLLREESARRKERADAYDRSVAKQKQMLEEEVVCAITLALI